MRAYRQKSIGQMLQEKREAGHVTQQEMAEACHLSKNHISAIERDLNKCNVNTLIGYCEKLSISPNDILYPEWETGHIIIELRHELSRLTAEQQEKLCAFIKALFPAE